MFVKMYDGECVPVMMSCTIMIAGEKRADISVCKREGQEGELVLAEEDGPVQGQVPICWRIEGQTK